MIDKTEQVTATRRRRPIVRARRGMSLVELLVAVMVLTIALLGLAGMSGTVSRQLGAGSRQTAAAMVVQSRLDSLASIAPCTAIIADGAAPISGTATTRGVTERWRISDGDNVIRIVDSVTFRGRSRPLVYESLIPCRN